MTIYYLNSASASEASPFDTWAKGAHEHADLDAVATTAGDTIRMNYAHVDTLAGALTISLATSKLNPVRLESRDPADDSYRVATAANLIGNSGGTFDIAWDTSFEGWGGWYLAGDDFVFQTTDTHFIFGDWTFEMSGASSVIALGASGGCVDSTWHNVIVKVTTGGTACGITFDSGQPLLEWNGGSVDWTGTQPTTFFKVNSLRMAIGNVRNVDFSEITSTLVDGSSATSIIQLTLINCIFNAALTVVNSIGRPGSFVRVISSDDTTANKIYRKALYTCFGTMTPEINCVRTGGASDHTIAIAWKMVCDTDSLEWFRPFHSEWIVDNFTSTGSKTITLHIIHDSLTNLQDDEVWLEVEHLGTAANTSCIVSTQTASATTNDKALKPTTAPADQTVSTETWSGTVYDAITNKNKQKLNITVTVNRIGPFRARICLAKVAGYTIYACPELVIS